MPEQVARGVVRLADEARYDVRDADLPRVHSSDAREWLASGELPELAKVTRLHLVDLDSGHWPQVTQPALLAGALAAAAS